MSGKYSWAIIGLLAIGLCLLAANAKAELGAGRFHDLGPGLTAADDKCEAMVKDIMAMSITNAFGLPITIFEIKDVSGFTPHPYSEPIQCSGIGYTSIGRRGIGWILYWLDAAKTRSYIDVHIF